jgi:chromosomal replication initiator protein
VKSTRNSRLATSPQLIKSPIIRVSSTVSSPAQKATISRNGVLSLNGAFSIPLGLNLSNSNVADRHEPGSATALPEFIADAENTLLSVITDRSEILQRQFSPVVLVGPTGVGKSFLAQGLVDRWSEEYAPTEVVTCTGADFARSLAEAIDTDAIDDFRNRFREAKVLFLDDITELARKETAQYELAQTLDHLQANEGLAIITSRTPPARLSRFLPRLVSRLSRGLVVPMKHPGPAARRELVMRLADFQGIQLSEDSITLLVSDGPPSVTALSGLVRQIKSLPDSANSVDPLVIHPLLANRDVNASANMSSLTKLVARRFRLKVADLKSSSRRQKIVQARGAAMFLARKHTGLSLQRIGEYFGKRDHTTVLHACRQTEDRLNSEPDLRDAVNEITNQLSGT